MIKIIILVLEKLRMKSWETSHISENDSDFEEKDEVKHQLLLKKINKKRWASISTSPSAASIRTRTNPTDNK